MSDSTGSHRAPTGVQTHEPTETPWDDETDFDILAQIETTGEATLPVLQELVKRVPTIDGAMVCTADGYNLCALGLEEAQVGRLAAMTSSLFSVSGAACGAVAAQSRSGTSEALDQVTLRSGDSQYMIFPIKHDQLGYLLLSVWAKDVSLGELLMEAKISAREVERIVHDELRH